MALNIPMPPANFGGGLLQGLVTGKQAKQNKQLMDQNWQKHLQDLAIKQQEQARLEQLFPLQQQLMNAQIQQALGNAFKSNMLGSLYAGDEAYSGGMGNYAPPQNGETQPPPMNGGYNNPSNQMGISNPGEGSPTNLPPTNEDYSALERQIKEAQTNPNYGQKAPLSEYTKRKEVVINEGNPKMYGLDRIAGAPGFQNVQTHFDADGNLIRTYPSGKVTMTPVGKTAYETAQSKETGKYIGKSYGEAVDASMRLGELGSNLNRLADALETNPNGDQVIGPINKHMAQIAGTPQDKLLLGEILTSSGNIIMSAAGGFKGAFRQGEQSLLNSMKPNATDPYWVFIGKLKAMGELTDLAKKREDIYSELVYGGMPPHEAIKEAQNQTNMIGLTDKFNKVLRVARARDDLNSGKMPSFSSKKEADEFLKSLPVEKRLKFLSGGIK